MSEAQFRLFLAAMTAQTAMLQSIAKALQALAAKHAGGATGENWKDLSAILTNARSITEKI
jgi:hypothetical protein